MDLKKIIPALFLTLLLSELAGAQLIGFRFGINSGILLTEFGQSDVLHPTALAQTPATAGDVFTPQPAIGFEGEVLFQIANNSYFGIEVDYTHLKGYNDDPLYYNYYLTPYFLEFQDEYFPTSVKYNTHMWNLAVNYKYFFLHDQAFQPFVKLTGVVALVGTDLMYKVHPQIVQRTGSYDSGFNVGGDSFEILEPESDVLYARGTSNANTRKWPAFHVGGGFGVNYDISDHLAFQVDGTVTIVNSGIIDGVPNFTYIQEEGQDILRYNRRLSLTMQVSASVIYNIELAKRKRGEGGKTDPHYPFYLKKR